MAHDLWVDGQRRDGEKERTVADLEGVITVKVPPSCSGDICLFRQVQQGRHRRQNQKLFSLPAAASAALMQGLPETADAAGRLAAAVRWPAAAAAGSIEM